MEFGFFHPDRGYWQAIGGDPADLLSTYPDSTVQVPLPPGPDYHWQDGGWVYKPDLIAMKAKAKAVIDEAAEIARLKYITPGVGQAMTYQQKSAEAAACMADEDPQPERYPLLAAEVGITASTLAGVALVVSQAYAQWAVIGAAIEAARLGAKSAVDAATDAPAVYAAADVEWP